MNNEPEQPKDNQEKGSSPKFLVYGMLSLLLLLVAIAAISANANKPRPTNTSALNNTYVQATNIPKKTNSIGASSSYTSGSSTSSSTKKEEYWCMGRDDTCKNKTTDPWDLYCSVCDKNNNNIEDRFE